MKELQILITDWGLSRGNIEKALSKAFNLKIVDFAKVITAQLQIKGDLTDEIQHAISKGQLISIELIGKTLRKNLKSIDENLLLINFPRTSEQLDQLKAIALEENIVIKQIWYFKLTDAEQFFKQLFEAVKNRKSLEEDKEKVINQWRIDYKKRLSYILEMQNKSNRKDWRIVEMDFKSYLDKEKIKRKITSST